MRGLFADVLADQAFGYLLCFARNLPHYIRAQAEARWDPVGGEESRQSFTVGPGQPSDIDRAHRTLNGATLGIVGLGSIGGEIARRSAVFGLRVLAVDPGRTDRPAEVAELWPVERLPDLLAESDYVVIAAPHTPSTQGWFRRGMFQQMKPTAYFVNIGRGAIVRLDDLVAALDAGEIAGAALDVFEREPLPADHPLWSRPDVILTPHVGGFAPHIAERHVSLLLDNIGRFVRGELLRNIVDKRQWF